MGMIHSRVIHDSSLQLLTTSLLVFMLKLMYNKMYIIPMQVKLACKEKELQGPSSSSSLFVASLRSQKYFFFSSPHKTFYVTGSTQALRSSICHIFLNLAPSAFFVGHNFIAATGWRKEPKYACVSSPPCTYVLHMAPKNVRNELLLKNPISIILANSFWIFQKEFDKIH